MRMKLLQYLSELYRNDSCYARSNCNLMVSDGGDFANVDDDHYASNEKVNWSGWPLCRYPHVDTVNCIGWSDNS